MKLKENSGYSIPLIGHFLRTRATPAIRNTDISNSATGKYAGTHKVSVARNRARSTESRSEASLIVGRDSEAGLSVVIMSLSFAALNYQKPAK
jgi:hypothetical protein